MRKKKASPKVRAEIIRLAKEGKVVVANPKALASVLSEAKGNQNFDWTVTNVELATGWKKWRTRQDGKLHGNNGGFLLRWATKSAGFGEICFYLDRKGRLHCDSEHLDKDFVKQVLAKLVEDVVMD